VSTTPPLALTNLVDISVTVAPTLPIAAGFNQGLFIGSSTVIPSYGANARLRQYSSTTAMLTDGFTASDPEYLAMQIYFSQNPPPQFGWVGRQDLTAIQTAVPAGRKVTDGAITALSTTFTSATANFISGDVGSQIIVAGAGVGGVDLVTTIASYTNPTTVDLTVDASTTVTGAATWVGAYGSGYKANDVITVVQSGASYGQLTVLTVGADGQVLTLGTTVGNQGTGYTVANGLSVTGGSGTGLEVDITAVGETLLQASQACRAASNGWYGLAVNAPADADNLALAAWATPLWQTTRYYPWSDTAAIVAGTTGNLALEMQAAKYKVLGTYATTQSGLYPNNVYAAAAVMGVEMGLNTGLAGSFFSTAAKQLVGIAPEPLTQTQYTNLVNAGFNAYCNFQPYQFYEPGFMSDGSPSYLWLQLAVLVANLQIDILDVIASNPVVQQTNAGEHLLLQGANQACANSASIGFIAPGIWNGAPVLGLATGDPLNLGYLAQAPPYSTISQADIDAGKAAPIYIAITSAGAVQSIVIGVYTQL
jgi:Protein of unknown function (DUF3383)